MVALNHVLVGIGEFGVGAENVDFPFLDGFGPDVLWVVAFAGVPLALIMSAKVVVVVHRRGEDDLLGSESGDFCCRDFDNDGSIIWIDAIRVFPEEGVFSVRDEVESMRDVVGWETKEGIEGNICGHGGTEVKSADTEGFLGMMGTLDMNRVL